MKCVLSVASCSSLCVCVCVCVEHFFSVALVSEAFFIASACVCVRVCVWLLYHSSLYQCVYICRFVFLRHFPVLAFWENHDLKRPLGSCPAPLSLLAATTAAGSGSGSPSLLLFHIFFFHFFSLPKLLSLLSTHTFKHLSFIIHSIHIN